jgi:universal stress protein E
MQDIKQILCVIDPTTTAQPAMLRAAWLAGQTGAKLELLVCYHNEYLSGERLADSPSLANAREEVLQHHHDRLEAMAEKLRHSNLVVTTKVIWQHPLYEGVVQHAAATQADIVFKDTHHHSAFARTLLTHTDWNLIRCCDAPLWLVKARDIPKAPIIVAAVDPMHEHDKPAALDDEILDLCNTLATASNATLRAFHSYDPSMTIACAAANAYMPASVPFAELDEHLTAEHQRRFHALIEKHGIDPDSSHLADGLVHQALPMYCKDIDASVVVMGAVSRNHLKRLFIGATAERTLEHLPCDLLVVKPGWYAEPTHITQDCAA